MSKKSGKKVLLLIASEAFDDRQLQALQEAMEKIGLSCDVASTVSQKAKGLHGITVDPDLIVDDVDPEKYDGVVLIGGHGSSQFWHDVYAHQIVRHIHQKGGLLAAVDRAPVVLGVAGVLKDRRATGSVSIFEKMAIYSREFTGKPVEVDGNIITAMGNNSLDLFVDAVISWFARSNH